jgi:hypothetical protein
MASLKSFQKLLAEANDADLISGVDRLIVRYYGEGLQLADVSVEERVVLLVNLVRGIVDNGGFRYLFEADLEGDPEYALTAEAFALVGCKAASKAVRQALAVFPDSRPPREADRRLRVYLSRIKRWPTAHDNAFFDAGDELERCLAKFIRTRVAAFRHLDGPPPRRPQVKPAPASAPSPGLALAKLPHWARVAFAVRCAREVAPLVVMHWPSMPTKYREGVRAAVELAGQSAAAGRAVAGLQQAVIQAVMAAGAASMGQAAPSGPVNLLVGGLASMVAKAAENAAEAARVNPGESVLPAMEAHDYAARAAVASEAPGLAEEMREDFEYLVQLATRERWTNRTPVPPEVWTR